MRGVSTPQTLRSGRDAMVWRRETRDARREARDVRRETRMCVAGVARVGAHTVLSVLRRCGGRSGHTHAQGVSARRGRGTRPDGRGSASHRFWLSQAKGTTHGAVRTRGRGQVCAYDWSRGALWSDAPDPGAGGHG